MKKVGIVMGSKSDLPIMQKAIEVLQGYGVDFQVRILSAHRCPEATKAFSETAISEGFGVLIAGAGMAAHLAGALAANTTLPVIGVPLRSSITDGQDALYSTVMMPSGIPVATVAIDGAKNAAILAVEILALSDETLAEKLRVERLNQKAKVLADDKEIQKQYSGE